LKEKSKQLKPKYTIMNSGERDELIVQLKLIQMRDENIILQNETRIESVGFVNKEYKKLPTNITLNNISGLNDNDLSNLASSVGITKAGGAYKADTRINETYLSVKSLQKAPPALVNHTSRPGFVFASEKSNFDIRILDKCVDDYWTKRTAGDFGEDVKNSNPNSPFAPYLNELRPVLNYFFFDGTGGSVSKVPAELILTFSDPLNTKTWRFNDKSNALDSYWDKMIFSLRAKKGMPNGYPDNLTKKMQPLKQSVERWTRYIDNDYRGALHIRSGS
jgi:hypothetical protein